MSNLSDLLPAGAAAKQLTFTDSGSGIASKKPVVIESDGDVTEVAQSSVSVNVGAETVFDAGGNSNVRAAGGTGNTCLIAYQDTPNSAYGTAIVGTISGTSISFGSEAIFESAGTYNIGIGYSSALDKYLIVYYDNGNSGYGTAVVATISGTSVTFGTPVVFYSVAGVFNYAHRVVYDDTAGAFVFGFMGQSNNCSAIACTVSGTVPTFGSTLVISSSQTYDVATIYESSEGKPVIGWRENATNTAKSCTLTVSGTSLTANTIYTFSSGTSTGASLKGDYDAAADRIVWAYQMPSDSYYGYAVCGEVSGNTITYGTAVKIKSAATEYLSVTYDFNVSRTIIGFQDVGNSNYGTIVPVTISGSTPSYGTETVINPAGSSFLQGGYVTGAKKIVYAFVDAGNSSEGTGLVLTSPGDVPNLTATNFVGVADSAISASAAGSIIVQGGTVSGVNAGQSASVGSEVVYEAARADHGMPIFDSSNNKVVIVYADNGDSDHGKAIVGTVSGSSVSYGTAVTFNAATTTRISGAFDSDSNKVVIAYRDDGDSNKTKAIVGTVSGTSISFGSDATITTNATGNPTSTTFDSNSNKVVVFYRDDDNSEYGTAAVGTVSGTSISFGTPVVFESATIGIIQSSSTFDSSNNKTVVAYRDVGNSSHGTAIVGTVSGTSISFGTAAVFHAASTEETFCTFDSGNNKVVVGYRDNAAPKALASSVGTVSGTSISFGTESTVQSISLYISNPSIAYSPDVGKVVLVYMDADNSSYGTYAVGEVSGTNITYETPAVFAAAATEDCGIAYDTNEDKFVVSFKDAANSNYGTSVVLTFSPIALTIGTKYYVTTSGGFSSSADTPSVNAGLAISTTSLLLNGDS